MFEDQFGPKGWGYTMIISDMRQRYYMQEIARIMMHKSADILGKEEESAGKSIDLAEMKRLIDGASKDETRLMRAIDRMVGGLALERDGFGWKTTATSDIFFRKVLAT